MLCLTMDGIPFYPSLLRCTWLLHAHTKEDWGKGILIIGKGFEKVTLPLFPTQYHGKTHDDGIELPMDDGYEIKKGITMSESIHRVNNGLFNYIPLGMREYFCAFGAMSLASQVFRERNIIREETKLDNEKVEWLKLKERLEHSIATKSKKIRNLKAQIHSFLVEESIVLGLKQEVNSLK